MNKLLSVMQMVAISALLMPGHSLAVDASRGPDLFQSNCRPCHSYDKGAKPDMYGFNLTLYGIIGRKSAAIDGYFYSDAMREVGITWNAELIELFITDPNTIVPDTRMMNFPGLKDPKDREDLVEFLKTMKD